MNRNIKIDSDITDSQGNTALMLAVKAGNKACVSLLNPHCDHGIVNDEGDTATHLTEDEEMISLLQSPSASRAN